MAQLWTIFNLILILMILLGYVLFIVIGWRFMKAHEAMAGAIKEIADSFKSREPETIEQ